jgi:hypothetical protein
MKNWIKYSLIGMLTLVYVTGIVGVGTLYCHCEDTSQVVWAAVHSHRCGDKQLPTAPTHGCCAEEQPQSCCNDMPATGVEHTTGNCCTVQVEMLQADQELPASQKLPAVFQFIFSLYYFPISIPVHSMPVAVTAVYANAPPLPGTAHSWLSRTAQWRL